MQNIEFIKFSGAGNDFVLIDYRLNPMVNLNEESIRFICDRRNGIGADGILLILPSEKADFDLKYYNADGSLGSLCGNGSRCAIKYAFNAKLFNGKKTSFYCENVNYHGEVFQDGNVKFNLDGAKSIKLNFKIKAHSQMVNASYVDTGSPHIVINVKDILSNPQDLNSTYKSINDLPVFELGREIRYAKDFAPKGMNVNFIEINDGKIIIRTYERGVEDETLACGTGSVASAVISSLLYGLDSPIELITRSGETLKVEFEKKNNQFYNIALIGPAKQVFTGNIKI